MFCFVLSIYAFTKKNSLSPCLLLASLVIILFFSAHGFCLYRTLFLKAKHFYGKTYSIPCWLFVLLFSLFSPCYCFISRFVQIFSMVNVYIQQIHVHLHILKYIVHLMQMVLLLSVLIMLKENVFVKHANIFIHLNIL